MNKKAIIISIIALAVLGGLFWAFKPKAKVVLPISKVFEFFVNNRKLVTDSGILHANVGDTVTLRVTVDESEELHLHGYDKSIDLKKGQPGEITFVANLTGRFVFELEKSKTELGTIEIQPK